MDVAMRSLREIAKIVNAPEQNSLFNQMEAIRRQLYRLRAIEEIADEIATYTDPDELPIPLQEKIEALKAIIELYEVDPS